MADLFTVTVPAFCSIKDCRERAIEAERVAKRDGTYWISRCMVHLKHAASRVDWEKTVKVDV